MREESVMETTKINPVAEICEHRWIEMLADLSGYKHTVSGRSACVDMCICFCTQKLRSLVVCIVAINVENYYKP